MTLELTGKNEPNSSYQEFYGHPEDKMPNLIAAGYDPISIAGVIGRRESAPSDVVDKWRRTYIFTGDGAAYDGRKNAKLALDAALLREINRNIRLDNGAMVLSNSQWEDLHGDGVLYLSADKVEQAHKNGFIKRNGVWEPENTIVGDVWEHLSRGKDLKEYAEMVSKASNSNKVMYLWFDRNIYISPVMRSLVVDSIGGYSNADGLINLDNDDNDHLVGVRRGAAVTHEKSSPQRIVKPTLEQTLAVINNPDLNRAGMVRAVSQLYKS